MRLFYQNQLDFSFEYRVNQLDYLPHIHNSVEIVFLQKGSSTVLCGGEWLELTAGDIFVAFPNQVHSYKNSRDVVGHLLILPVKNCLNAYSTVFSGYMPHTARIPKGSWEHTGLPQLVELAYRDREQVSETVMLGYMQVIFGKLLPLLVLDSTRNDSGDAVRLLVEYVGAHYREPLSRAQIAKALGYNESYISHLFSEALNTTVPEYVNRLRIYDAQKMLLGTDHPITRIVSELGFGSIRNFNRVFQQKTGMSPSAYRNAAVRQ